MTSRTLLSALSSVACAALVMTGCTTTPEPAPEVTYVEVPPQAPLPPPEPRVVAVPYAQPIPGQAKPLPLPQTEPSEEAKKAAKASKRSNKEILDEANKEARLHPTQEGYFNAVQVYDYIPGALYQLWGAPNHLTLVMFKPGEEIISVLAGDTHRWEVERTFAVEEGKARQILAIKPRRREQHTTMTVTTNIGVYIFELHSYQHTYMASIAFNHPSSVLELYEEQYAAGLEQAARGGKGSAQDTSAALEVSLEDLEDSYRFIVKDRKNPPRWAPRRVFHDGRRTFIDFGREIGDRELPVLFVLGSDKSAHLTNYTVQGRYLIVGQVLERAMLRLGDRSGRDAEVGIELIEEARR